MNREEYKMEPLVDVSIVKDHIAIVTLQRASAANSFSLEMLEALNKQLDYIQNDASIYCTIITGEGHKAFCAGADLKERKGMNDEQVLQTVAKIGDTITKVENLRSPVIAALNGVAFGGGLELALACDIRYAVDHASMGLTETSLAIIPGAGGTQRLPRIIGRAAAKRLIFTAERISAKKALEIGLIEDVFEKGFLMAEALKTAEIICKNGPLAVSLSKEAINRGMEVPMKEALEIEQNIYKETLHTKDRAEGLLAFSEKRTPQYRGK